MKELSIEEKAKRYDEILARAVGANLPYYNDAIMSKVKEFVEYLLPELKESEGERTWIINYLSNRILNSTIIAEKENLKKAIAWVEKQGEQKAVEWHREDEQNLNSCLGYIPDEFLRRWLMDVIHVKYDEPADKVEPKFRAGEWVVIDGEVLHIKEVTEDGYFTDEGGLIPFRNEKEVHIWTIQDAKDGDLLADNYGIYIFDRFDECDERSFICKGAYQYSQKVYENEHMLCSVEVHPATKEQHDLLFQKMKEAGYSWDAEKKELKKIEQNPAWSKEDEKEVAVLEAYIRSNDWSESHMPSTSLNLDLEHRKEKRYDRQSTENKRLD